jgi:manganese transport protein
VTGRLGLIGPAFVAAVAYVDPGNFATNVTAGARHGYVLVWVVVLANLMAMLVQYLSAKIGVVTGRDLPELCRDHFPRTVTRGLWIQAELIAIATDLAEFVGAAVGLNLLLGVPLFPAGVITAVVASGLLVFQQRGYRHFELAITGLLGLVLLGLCYNLSSIHLSPGPAARGLVPGFDGSGSLLLAAGIIGATVMPHALYLHSGLTKNRVIPASDSERHRLLRFQRIDVIAGLTGAGFINLALILVAAATLWVPTSTAPSRQSPPPRSPPSSSR